VIRGGGLVRESWVWLPGQNLAEALEVFEGFFGFVGVLRLNVGMDICSFLPGHVAFWKLLRVSEIAAAVDLCILLPPNVR